MQHDVDLSDKGEPKNTFILRFRVRDDGRDSTWVSRLRISEDERVARNGKGSPYVVKSYRTTDLTEAMKQAVQWRQGWGPGNSKKARLANVPTFAQAADRWLNFERLKAAQVRGAGKRSRSETTLSRWDTCVRRYLKPIFGQLPVNAITRDDGERWGSWRQRYYVDGPGKDEIENDVEYIRGGKKVKRPAQANPKLPRNTLAKDADAFNKVLAFSRSEYPHLRWAEQISLLDVGVATEEAEARDPFDRSQRSHIFEAASARAHGVDFERYDDPPFNREVLYNLVRFLWCTGLRIAEVKRLRVKHVLIMAVPDQEPIFVPNEDATTLGYEGVVDEFSQEMLKDDPDADEYGFKYQFNIDWVKRKSHRRKVVPRLGIYGVMQRHLGHLERHFANSVGDRPLPVTSHDDMADLLSSLPANLPLFPDERGREFGTMGKMHNRLLDKVRGDFEHGLRVIDGRTMSLSCWRHTYATELLGYFITRQNPNLVHWLAKNMGTSPSMIHKHYGHILMKAAEKEFMV